GIVASAGTFGYELDPALLSEEEKQEIREQIREFHKYYWLIQDGEYYRLGSESFNKRYNCWEFVSKDRSEALVNLVAVNIEANALFPYVNLKGLEEDAVYQLEGTDLKVSGAALMYGGYTLELFSGNYPAVRLHFIRCE
ncbi:MAG: GH36 C-terminal domain-containing protein, partial [Blautia sp.]|nr:GH36 C-terminal domain-containing protein [Blautia sp.]